MSLTPDPRGPNLHVGDDVTIGEGVEFGANVVVHDGCSIGAGTLVGDNAVHGKRPALGGSSTAKRGPLPGLAIGANCTVSTGAIVFAGTTLADNVIVGDLAVVRERVTIGSNSVVGRGALDAVEDREVIAPLRTGENCQVYGPFPTRRRA